MPNLTIAVGVALALLGIISYVITGQESVTALIPTFFGIAFLICGFLAKKENLRKHAMHGAAVFALLGIFGTISSVGGIIDLASGNEVERVAATYGRFIMLVICVGFVIAAVKSFIAARKSAE